MKTFVLLLRIVAAVIMLQTLFFKFTGAEEARFIFTSLGIEPWGRWAVGISELIASILLILPSTQVLGALMAMGMMIGAILSHLFVLGIAVRDDGGLLFFFAWVVFLSSAIIIFVHRHGYDMWSRGKGKVS